MYMQLRVLSVFLILICSPILGQKQITLKKKYFGAYTGEIPGFQIDSGNEIVDISASKIRIELVKDSIHFQIGPYEKKGTWTVLFEGDNYFVLDCPIEGHLDGERIVIYKRGKKISRDGLNPQPNAFLFKED